MTNVYNPKSASLNREPNQYVRSLINSNKALQKPGYSDGTIDKERPSFDEIDMNIKLFHKVISEIF